MKDVAYFISSCLQEDESETLESTLLDYYFSILHQRVNKNHTGINAAQLESEWRELYDVAWADFHCFLKGWSPGHWKIYSYSENLTSRVVKRLNTELVADGSPVFCHWSKPKGLPNRILRVIDFTLNF